MAMEGMAADTGTAMVTSMGVAITTTGMGMSGRTTTITTIIMEEE
jgi:hypothetical protein